MQLIVGLGNPGAKYLMTRHNIGFMVVDSLAHQLNEGQFKSEHKSLVCKAHLQGEVVLLAKPQKYMNLSGESVRALIDYYSIPIENILVVHDDIDQAFGALRFQVNRGHGGHNGIRDIHKHLNSKEYNRLKLGVGRPSHAAMDVADYVLQNFNSDEQKKLPDFLNLCVDSVECYILNGLNKAATKYNSTPQK